MIFPKWLTVAYLVTVGLLLLTKDAEGEVTPAGKLVGKISVRRELIAALSRQA